MNFNLGRKMCNFCSSKELLSFLIGFAISTLFVINIINNYPIKEMHHDKNDENVFVDSENKRDFRNSNNLYESELADKLFNDIRVLCWVFTHPSNHKIKVPHVKKTWGHRCNKLLFMSIEKDPNNPDIIPIPVPEGRSHLWNKTRLVMKYVYENHFNEADWFMRADDDKYEKFYMPFIQIRSNTNSNSYTYIHIHLLVLL
jgi:hypothetical protein